MSAKRTPILTTKAAEAVLAKQTAKPRAPKAASRKRNSSAEVDTIAKKSKSVIRTSENLGSDSDSGESTASDASWAEIVKGKSSLSKTKAAQEAAAVARLAEKAERDAKVAALMMRKNADLDDDGLLTVAEYRAAQGVGPEAVDGEPPAAYQSNEATSALLRRSEELIAARPEVAVYEGAKLGKVGDFSSGALMFLSKIVEIHVAPTDELPGGIKKRSIVSIFQFLHPPDIRIAMRLVLKVATNESPPRGATDQSMLGKAEAVTLSLDSRDNVYQVSPVGWNRIVDLVTFRKTAVIGEISWAAEHLEDASSDIENGDGKAGDSKSNSVDEMSAVALAFIAKAKEAAGLHETRPRLELEGLTTPAPSQISFGKPAQYWLTPVSSIEASKRIALKAKSAKTGAEDYLADSSGKSSSKRFCTLGMSSRIADVVSCAPHQTILTDVHEGWGRVKDRLGVPVCTAIFAQILISWTMPIHPSSILYFVALKEHEGANAATLMLRSFDGFTSEKLPLDPAFENLWKTVQMPVANITLDILERSVERYMLMIFSAWDLRLMLQEEMLRSVDRLFTYLRNNSLSSSNANMLKFATAAVNELMASWINFAEAARSLRRQDLDSTSRSGDR